MGRGDQLARSRLLERALVASRRGVSIRQWAAENGYHWRTVYRDLQHLQASHVPVVEIAPGRYGVDPDWKVNVAAMLSAEEVVALYSLKEIAAPWRHTGLGRAVERIWAKLGADARQTRLVPSSVPGEALSIRSFVGIDYGRFHRFVETFEAAIAGRRAVDCRYRSLGGEVTKRVVEPGQLHFDSSLGSLYLIGWCRLRRAVRVFAVHRFLAARMTDEALTPRPETRSAAALRNAFRVWRETTLVTVRARLRGTAAAELRERRWHASQKHVILDDGEVEVTFEVAGLAEVERWLLGYGADAVALSPPELAERMQRHHEEGAQRQRVVSSKDGEGVGHRRRG